MDAIDDEFTIGDNKNTDLFFAPHNIEDYIDEKENSSLKLSQPHTQMKKEPNKYNHPLKPLKSKRRSKLILIKKKRLSQEDEIIEFSPLSQETDNIQRAKTNSVQEHVKLKMRPAPRTQRSINPKQRTTQSFEASQPFIKTVLESPSTLTTSVQEHFGDQVSSRAAPYKDKIYNLQKEVFEQTTGTEVIKLTSKCFGERLEPACLFFYTSKPDGRSELIQELLQKIESLTQTISSMQRDEKTSSERVASLERAMSLMKEEVGLDANQTFH
ncbi:nicotinamide-nucleotide adenylyltransferase [Acrasis kona]|uniref:Nicotinamide-nucleotide adenylyltransferase n=1 Tax=Acrasis kona TaxID=1008807 RepID=A0AAW2ZRP3_9EUKA